MVTSAAELDYEKQTTHDITVRVTDDGVPSPLYYDQVLTVTVTDVNEPPTAVSLSKTKIPENSQSGDIVGNLKTEDPDNLRGQKQTFTYNLTDSAGGRFKIQNNQLVVDNADFDYEKEKSYTISLTTEDNVSPPLKKDVTFNIEILDSNDPPTQLSISAQSVVENSPLGTPVGVLSAVDEDVGQSLSYSMSGGSSFSVTGNTVIVSGAVDFETTPSITFEVKVQDNGFPPLSTAKNFTIQVTDINEKPAEIKCLDVDTVKGKEIAENLLIGDIIGKIVAYDPDVADKMTFTLSESDVFKLPSATPVCTKSVVNPYFTECKIDVLLKKIVNYEDETQRTQPLNVMVTDHNGLKLKQEFIFNIINANEPPYDILLGGEIRSIPENTPGFQIGKLESLDDDQIDEHIYQVITHWEVFGVLNGMLTAIKPLDFEQKPSYSVTIKSKDNGIPSQSFSKTFVFNVTDENEAPTDIKLSSTEVSNAATVGEAIGIVTVTDPDNNGITQRQNHTCTVGEEGVGVFTVDNSKMILKVIGTIPLETTQMNITLTCKDSVEPPLSMTALFVMEIKETIIIPKVVVLKDQHVVPENLESFTVGRLEVVNELSQAPVQMSFLYLMSSHDVPFRLDGDLLIASKPLDYESKSDWEVIVTASGMDNGKAVDLEATLKVEVSDVNEAPYKIRVYGGGYIHENGNTGTIIGDLNTEDHEMDQIYTYNILGIAKGLDIANTDPDLIDVFKLDGRTLKVGAGAEQINYEESSVFTLQISSIDSGTPPLSINDTINIVIQDINDPPSDIVLESSSVAENSVIGTIVSNIKVEDEDKDQGHTCDIQNSRDVPFDITEEQQLVVSRAEIDYESTKTYVVEILCEDKGQDGTQLSVKKALVITVTNVNEPPSEIVLSKMDVSESSQPGEVIGQVSASDPDSTKVTFTVEGSSLFKIEGEDTLVTVGELDFEQEDQHTITIKATDDRGLTSTKDFILKVLDENEAPTKIKLDNTMVEENLNQGSLIGTFSTEDPDRGQSFTYILVPGENDGYFVIEDNKLVAGELVLDFETNNEHKILVMSKDNGEPSKSIQEEFSITIENVNDPPEAIIFGTVPPLKEDTPSKTVVTTMQIDDPDVGQSHSCSLQTKSTPFNVLTNENAEKSLVLNHVLDFETAESYNLVIQCSDGEFDIQKSLTVIIIDVNEAPTSVTLSGSNTVLADGQPGDVIGKFSVEDPDHNQAHSFVLKGPNSDLFTVLENKLTLISTIPKEILTNADPVIRITVQASDNGNPVQYIQQNFTLLITNIEILAAELPAVAIDNVKVAEDSSIGTVIGTLYNVNQSVGEDVVFELEKNPENLFSIKDNRFLVLENSLADYVGTSVTVVVRVRNVETFDTSSSSITVLIIHVDRCLKDGMTCDENAPCIQFNETFHDCHCEQGFSGDGYTCTNIDDCHGVDACQNGATCVDGIEDFSCICPKDFIGSRCETSLTPTNPCNKDPCRNKGGCTSDGKSYICHCTPGWTGATCAQSVDECENSACLAGGQCIDKHRTYICDCPPQRNGPRCEYFTDTCKADNCHNGTMDMCIPLYNSDQHTCAKSIEDLVKLIVNKPETGSLDELEFRARITDHILSLLDRTGATTTSNRRRRRSTTDEGELQVYIVTITDNGDGTITVDFVVLNPSATAYTVDEVIEMLSLSCSDIAKEGQSESEVCPAVMTFQQENKSPAPQNKEEGGSLGAIIGGAIGGVVVVVIIIVIIVIVMKKKETEL